MGDMKVLFAKGDGKGLFGRVSSLRSDGADKRRLSGGCWSATRRAHGVAGGARPVQPEDMEWTLSSKPVPSSGRGTIQPIL